MPDVIGVSFWSLVSCAFMEINIPVNPLRIWLQTVVVCERVDFKDYLYSGSWSCQFHVLDPLSSILDSRKRA